MEAKTFNFLTLTDLRREHLRDKNIEEGGERTALSHPSTQEDWAGQFTVTNYTRKDVIVEETDPFTEIGAETKLAQSTH